MEEPFKLIFEEFDELFSSFTDDGNTVIEDSNEKNVLLKVLPHERNTQKEAKFNAKVQHNLEQSLRGSSLPHPRKTLQESEDSFEYSAFQMPFSKKGLYVVYLYFC